MWLAYDHAQDSYGFWWEAALEDPWITVDKVCPPEMTRSVLERSEQWGPLAWAIIVRAPWDPQEPPRGQKRYKQEGSSQGAHQTLNDITKRTPADVLAGMLLDGLKAVCASCENLAEYGTTFHSVVIRVWGEWGADVFGGTNVERAWWDLFKQGDTAFAFRRVEGDGPCSAPIPFFIPTELISCR